MGTRNVMIVTLHGEVKVRQYCQWDGYPTGQGIAIADFIQSADMSLFKSKVEKLKFLTPKQVSAKIKKLLGHDNQWISIKEGDLINQHLPALSRDTGSNLLGLIQNGQVKQLQDCKISEAEGCIEFLYEINLDDNTVTVKTDCDVAVFPFSSFTAEAMVKLEKYLAA